MKGATKAVLDKLKDRGCRITKTRIVIVEAIAKAKNSVTIKGVAEIVEVDEASVYRTINLLKEAGLVEEIVVKNDRPHYALAHGHHHHVVCRDCGRISHVPCHNEVQTPKLAQGFSVVEDHDLTFYGLCVKCG